MQNCRACGIELTKDNSYFGWGYCKEHYICVDCGETDNRKLCLYTEGLLCNNCHQNRVDKRTKEFKGSTSYTDEIVCPYCGYKLNDSWELEGDECDCPDCERTFEVTRYTTIEYCTRKLTEVNK
jgi:DNA-directed RNA polymerase subunit RPC12/RpoP